MIEQSCETCIEQSCETCIFFKGGSWCRLFKRRKANQDGKTCRHYDFKSPDYQSPFL